MKDCRRSNTLICLVGLLLAIIFVSGLGCSSSPPEQSRSGVDEEFERTSRAARTAFDNGKLQQALSLYSQALERAYVLDDLNAIVDSQYNLAVCLTGLRSYGPALERVTQAKLELARVNKSMPADVLLLEATIQHRLGNLDDAWQLTEQLVQESNLASAAVIGKTHFLRGLIASERGDISQLRREIAFLDMPAAAGLRSDREELAGLLSMAKGNWNEAAEAFDRTAELRREDLDYSGMVNALAQAAWSYEQAGKLSEASKRYLRAGRSAAQQGERDNASNWLTLAEKIAGEAGDELTAKQARSYRKWLEKPQL
jgi:tetratricopeptide (TPR) repeat protein